MQKILSVTICALCLLAGCDQQTASSAAPNPSNPPSDQQTYQANGVVKKLEVDGKTVIIQHDAISNYMGAMTMPFEVRNPKELAGLKSGDAVSFRLVVTSNEGWIDSISVRQKAGEGPIAVTSPGVRVSPAVELGEGDLLPDYHFTNELGRAVDLSQYKGQVLAFTFFFTSCPFPNYCPRMTGNFEETSAFLHKIPQAPAKWHLLSISFDPKTDTPQHLEEYAKNAHYDPAHWSFLTGDPEQIQGLADQFGENYWSENGSISHNLRTVVVDPTGRVRRILQGNNWTPDDLIREMIKAKEAVKSAQ